ncbi:lysylphosphatidylglycerol synthase transmembrane domain-containing protein [Novosphingobium album (ex Liu et al. 2023)]|uniref:Lysylphosphatidylglycerol synthase transmembrane domain-containing protein n=1 Tax=Novosphingobium album (ex Liu et al. 2023) TaxID=3031130 RepID=A0ABT5WUX6_9SPHN|nr:lysylphosphatidylglycerol synthase transmembrane domain-containing protein [Novosphingobium album (ex Liu et al. 2023)]MDE8653676.1 lysylphosphatidylglycerol synthase transmembrane domain-containing protein [Novosphingobium album (ex Liu et al. 2023)]
MPDASPRSRGTRWGGGPWRSWLSGLLIAAALVAAVLHFAELEDFAALVQRAQPLWLLLAVALQASTYIFVAVGWRLIVRDAGHDPPLASLVRIAVTKLFADQAVPTGGMSGNILLVDQLIALGIPRGVASAALIVTIVGYYAAFIICALVTLALLWFNHDASPALAVVLTVFLGLAVGIPAIALWFGRGASGWLASRLRRVPWLARTFETIASAPPRLLRNRALIIKVAACNLVVFLADAATLWACLHSLGLAAAPWKAFVALVMASVVTTLGPIPMGLGSFEATATGMLRLVGVPTEAAFAATMLLRLFILWLPLVPGLALVRKLRRHRIIPHGKA